MPCLARAALFLEKIMDQNDFDAKISAAWKAHYNGQHEQAIEQFRKLVDQAPDHIDANWGLGLSYRKAGDKTAALQVFQKVRDLVNQKLEADPEEYERFFMLKRMITQQIEQINEFIE
jgi:Flp pilus assembly protein TadD